MRGFQRLRELLYLRWQLAALEATAVITHCTESSASRRPAGKHLSITFFFALDAICAACEARATIASLCRASQPHSKAGGGCQVGAPPNGARLSWIASAFALTLLHDALSAGMSQSQADGDVPVQKVALCHRHSFAFAGQESTDVRSYKWLPDLIL
jgi:hypothetical protein